MTAHFDSPALFTRWTGDVLGRGELELVPALVADTYFQHTQEGNSNLSAGELADAMAREAVAAPGQRHIIDDFAVLPGWIWLRYRVAQGEGSAEQVAFSGLQLYRVEAGKLAEGWGARTAPGVDWAAPIAGAPPPPMDEGEEPVDLPLRAHLTWAFTEEIWKSGRSDLHPEYFDAPFYRHDALGNSVQLQTAAIYRGVAQAAAANPGLRFQTFNSALSDRCSWSRWQARSPGGTGLTWLDSARLQVFRFRNNRMAETWTLGANPGVTWDGDA